MNLIKPDVATICAGMAASMASILLTGGAPGKRYALPYAKILIHQPWVQQVGGQATDIEIHARDLIATRRSLAGIYEQTVKKPIEQILKDIERDYYMTAEEARGTVSWTKCSPKKIAPSPTTRPFFSTGQKTIHVPIRG